MPCSPAHRGEAIRPQTKREKKRVFRRKLDAASSQRRKSIQTRHSHDIEGDGAVRSAERQAEKRDMKERTKEFLRSSAAVISSRKYLKRNSSESTCMKPSPALRNCISCFSSGVTCASARPNEAVLAAYIAAAVSATSLCASRVQQRTSLLFDEETKSARNHQSFADMQCVRSVLSQLRSLDLYLTHTVRSIASQKRICLILSRMKRAMSLSRKQNSCYHTPISSDSTDSTRMKMFYLKR
jgi:hypothetical protein